MIDYRYMRLLFLFTLINIFAVIDLMKIKCKLFYKYCNTIHRM